MNIDESILGKLTDGQRKKVETARSAEELLALAKEEGFELTQEQMEAVAGGWNPCDGLGCWAYSKCAANQ